VNPAALDDRPSAWVRRWSHLVAPGASVLDLACGSGRHARWFAARGCRVTAVDRDGAAVRGLEGVAEAIVADLERGPWPLAGRTFDAFVVTNYLWRERLAQVIAGVAAGGVLIYETFAAGNERFGRPSNPDFLLRPGELLQAVQGLQVVAFEDGLASDPARSVQRVVAVREPAGTPCPARHPLEGPAAGRTCVKSPDSEDCA
jgi:SAM-dependent methyltransferase